VSVSVAMVSDGASGTNNIEGKDIMQISGHKNIASINNYSAISENKQREISNILSNNIFVSRNLHYIFAFNVVSTQFFNEVFASAVVGKAFIRIQRCPLI
jgi:hypothetical protein